jgi:serine/threonine-protein kinase
MLPPGSRLGGYEVGPLVGRGGMGEVYRAKQLSMDREVALKVLSPKLARQDPSFADKFVAEARAAGRLNHPNIVGVHDVGNATAPEGCHGIAAKEVVHYFSMEFIEGETVKDVIERQGAVDIETVARIMTGMGEALAFAEAHKIVHRDIKPDNIMMTGNGLVKLADLGLALHTDSEEAVVGAGKDEQGRSKVMGTPLYMAPEQARAQPVDHRADQYALGATLYHMLTGRPPYTGESAKAIMRAHCFEEIPDPQEENPETPPIWRELCMRLMAKGADERFASAAELRTAIKAAVRWKPGSRLR